MWNVGRSSRMFALFLLFCPLVAASAGNLKVGDAVGETVFVVDMSGEEHTLMSLLGRDHATLNVLYLFGGGDMGSLEPGRLWCPDSVQDAYIIRSLYAKYANNGVNFILVAVPPVYHPERAFKTSAKPLLDHPPESPAYQSAKKAFVESTLAAYLDGTLPLLPYYDLGNRLMMNPDPGLGPGKGYGTVFPWQGEFRDVDDSQRYGVPSLWLISNQGVVIAKPLRGNRYFNHGNFNIEYSLTDVDAAIELQLQ